MCGDGLVAQRGPVRLLVIVGPTAVGKSALAIRLAQEFEGEIISADSRQIYRYMDTVSYTHLALPTILRV